MFLTGIYTSVNEQTVEIRKWYELMITIQADHRVHVGTVDSFQRDIERYHGTVDERISDHEYRIRELESDIPTLRLLLIEPDKKDK